MSRWSDALTRRTPSQPKPPKYHNDREKYSGYSFASKLEREIFQMLNLRMKAGEFDLIRIQATILLTEAEIRYIADFECIKRDPETIFYVEAKGFEGERWRIIKKLYKHYGKYPLEIWRMGSQKQPYLAETIVPK